MPTTPNGLAYPVLGGANNPPADFQTLAEGVDHWYGQSVADWAALLAIASPFPGMRVFVTSLGDVATYKGSAWFAPKQWKTKANDETVTSSTTLQNDNDLVATISGPGTWRAELDLFLLCAAGVAGDIKVGFSFPAGGTLDFHGIGADIGLGAGTAVSTGNWQVLRGASSGSAALSFGTTASLTMGLRIEATLIATQAGTWQLMWAQDASSSNAAEVLQRSHMICEQVAA